jgi:uncharacterized protein YegL
MENLTVYETHSNFRRLPVYLVLDVSGSMSGEPIEAVRQGVKALLSDLRGDPMALENVYLSVITFASDVQQTPLCDLCAFQEPILSAGGCTSLGGALAKLAVSIDNDVRKSTPTCKGDYKPLIFLMTDGQPTDEWEKQADAIKAKRPGNLIALAAGSGADKAMLSRITEVVLEIKNLQPDQLKAFFKWVSGSIKTASVRAGGDGPVGLPSLPPGVNVVS